MPKLDFAISVLKAKRNNIHALPDGFIAQLDKAIEILNEERSKTMKRESAYLKAYEKVYEKKRKRDMRMGRKTL